MTLSFALQLHPEFWVSSYWIVSLLGFQISWYNLFWVGRTIFFLIVNFLELYFPREAQEFTVLVFKLDTISFLKVNFLNLTNISISFPQGKEFNFINLWLFPPGFLLLLGAHLIFPCEPVSDLMSALGNVIMVFITEDHAMRPHSFQTTLSSVFSLWYVPVNLCLYLKLLYVG